MVAGAAKIPVRILGEWLPMEGMEKIRDLPSVRCIWMVSGQEAFLFISVEATSIREQEIHTLKQSIYEKTGIRPEQVWISATHTFNVPHFRVPKEEVAAEPGEKLFCAVKEAVLSAVSAAMAITVPVQVGFGTGISDVSINRDVVTEEGWWLGENPAGTKDPRLQFLVLQRMDGKVLAVLGVFAVQSSVLHGGGNGSSVPMISADLLGEASGTAERNWSEAVVMLLTGAAGDQAPAKSAVQNSGTALSAFDESEENTIKTLEILGRKLGSCLIEAVGKIHKYETDIKMKIIHRSVRVKGQVLPRDIRTLHPVLPGNWKYRRDKDRKIEIVMVSLGRCTIFGVAPELPAAMGLKLSAGREDEPVFLCTMVDGAAKYMAYRESYETCRYEAMNSMFAEGSAELLEKTLESMLRNSRKEKE